ncbi:hypothetical protein GCM10020258_52990 [Sphingomonas yabuuchiae]
MKVWQAAAGNHFRDTRRKTAANPTCTRAAWHRRGTAYIAIDTLAVVGGQIRKVRLEALHGIEKDHRTGEDSFEIVSYFCRRRRSGGTSPFIMAIVSTATEVGLPEGLAPS